MSEGGANPWGVSLNRLSFKSQPTAARNASSKNPYNYISSPKTTNTQTKTKTKTKAKAKRKSVKEDEAMEVIEPIEPIERAKKRKLRRQLSLAKMQMSVLKARLGLEQMKSPRTIHEDVYDNAYEDIPEMPDPDHSRSVSVSTENLLATIESMGGFENDIKQAIQKVDDLMHEVNTDQCRQLTRQNETLKHELDAIKKKMKEVQTENTKLKQLQSGSGKAVTKATVAVPIKKEFKPNPLEKYNKMKDLGMPMDKIVAKMEKAQIDSAQIEEWKTKHSSKSADRVLASKVNAKEQLYEKYDKMKKIGMPDASIRNKMRMDGFKEDEMDRYLGGNSAADATGANSVMAKYDRMKKMGMPQHVIQNKMRLDGISQSDQDTYFNPPSMATTTSQAQPSAEVAKYERMKKMGMPVHAIVNKMRLDGISAAAIDAFEHPNKKKKEKEKEKDERIAKYDRMKKMGMPMHAIVNKMRLDGIEQSLIHKFEHHEEDSEEDSEGEDPNEANKINLNIPALAKYNRMKKMGMPMHAVVNKMKLDGIDANIVDAFEHPDSNKKNKKKRGGFGGLFHKRKSSIPPKQKIKPNVDMKRFHWQTVDYKLARNSIWKTMDEQNVTESINIGEFESLFSIPKKENKLAALLKKKDAQKDEKKEEVKFVSAKRQYNVELLLKRLKFNGAALCCDIIAMNEEKLSLDLLIKVSDMVPSDEEQMQAIGNSNKHDAKRIAKYGIVEKFFYDLSSIWSLQERIKLWIFKKEFAEICQHQSDKIRLLNKGLSDIQGSEGLYEVFKIILAFGNYMNGGRRNGQAYGFSLETLRMLSGTKGTDGSTTLLMYIYKYTKCNAPQVMDVVKQLENVSAAVKIDIDALDKKIHKVQNELNKLPNRLKEFKAHTKKMKQDVYVAKMTEWLQSAQSMMRELLASLDEMRQRAEQLAKTYAYALDDANNTINQFLKIFDDFVKDWNKAKIKYTKMEEKRKKDALRAKKKEEAQARLQAKLSGRKVKRKDLEKKNIWKDRDKVKKEEAINAKLKKTLKAHVRKQTVMKQMFTDVLNQSDEEEEDEEESISISEDDPPYKEYINSYNNGNNNNNNNNTAVTNFNPDDVPKEKKKTEKNSKNKQYAFRGKKAAAKKEKEATGPLYKKQMHATPAASQFGNVWELNFSPMSRTAYSQSKAPKKKKKVKYKSGHVRRETRLKKAFESMQDNETQNKSKSKAKAKAKAKAKPKAKANNNNNNNKVTVSSPKSRGNEMYSKYKTKNRFQSKKGKANTMQMEF